MKRTALARMVATRSRVHRAAVAASVLLAGVVGQAAAYHGGPVRALVWGLDGETSRIYFELQAHDESGDHPQVFCLDLESDRPSEPQRLEHLEDRYNSYGKTTHNPEWVEVRSRCERLKPVPEFDVAFSLASDSTGVDPNWNVTVLKLEIRLRVGGLMGRLDVEGCCQPRAGLRALYLIPGRPERLAIVSYVGRPYGCEEVERAVLLQPSRTD